MAEGHNEPCYACGELCNSLTGDPGEWPTMLPAEQSARPFHMKCAAAMMREAARYRWRDISETPTEPGMVEYYHANWPPEVDCPDSPFRDERRDIGHFDGQHFREKGTDHEVFESWKEPWMLPTHWRYLPPAPDDAEIAREKGP
jgi:hypothetical protein